MKKLSLFFAFLCALLNTNANATQIAAGNIRVEAIVFTDFNVFAEFYTNCAGDPPPLTISMCAEDLMNLSNSFTITLYRDSTYFDHDTNSGKKVPIGWGPDSTQCDDPSSTIPGYRHWSYYNLVTFPTVSTIWRLSTYFDTLEATNNIVDPSPFYTECTMDMYNNFAGNANSSVYIPQPKVFYVPTGAPYTLNLDGWNSNADSFYFEIDTVITTTAACGTASPAAFQAASPAYSIPGNPFQTNNSLTLNQTVLYAANGTATVNFTPTQAGNYLFGVRTNALRIYGNGGVWGQLNAARHWFRVIVLGSSTPPATCDTFSGGTLGCFTNCVATGDTVIGLYNQPVSFCYKAQSADTNVKYYVTDNHLDSIPAATTTYTGQHTDTVTSLFSWTPNTSADTGWHTIMYDIIDSACAIPVHYTDTVHIYIPGPVSVKTLNNKHQLSLYPNPNNGHFTLISDIDITGKIEVINTLGEVVYKTTNTKNITLPDGLPNGTYLLKAYRKNTPVNIPFILNR